MRWPRTCEANYGLLQLVSVCEQGATYIRLPLVSNQLQLASVCEQGATQTKPARPIIPLQLAVVCRQGATTINDQGRGQPGCNWQLFAGKVQLHLVSVSRRGVATGLRLRAVKNKKTKKVKT